MLVKQTRNTIQKNLILNAVRELDTVHPSAEQVYRLVSLHNPNISRSTVYRNLNLLVEAGQISRLPSLGSYDRYDPNPEKHYHVICKICGKVSDVSIPYYTQWDGKISEDNGYCIENHAILFEGICPECQQKL